jgi:hypothetical protein
MESSKPKNTENPTPQNPAMAQVDNTRTPINRQFVSPNTTPKYSGRNETIKATENPFITEYDRAHSFGIDIASFGTLGLTKIALKPSVLKNAKLLMSFKNIEVGAPGVYDLGTTLGKYVGQSKDIIKRVTAHFASGGKLKFGELENAVFHAMPGSTKLQREVYEQFLINKYGLKNLINERNPMGGRTQLFENMIDDVINQFNLPK